MAARTSRIESLLQPISDLLQLSRLVGLFRAQLFHLFQSISNRPACLDAFASISPIVQPLLLELLPRLRIEGFGRFEEHQPPTELPQSIILKGLDRRCALDPIDTMKFSHPGFIRPTRKSIVKIHASNAVSTIIKNTLREGRP